MGSTQTDPLVLLPSELILQILDFASVSTVSNLTRLNTRWHNFIDEVHQDAIYSAASKTLHPPDVKDMSFLRAAENFTRCEASITRWKDLCRWQIELAQKWAEQSPLATETILQVGNDPVWRFRPDFQRRFFMATYQSGGLSVTDMDTGESLWRLSYDDVRPFAHLEYEDGTAVWDRGGDSLEVWQLSEAGRGHFERTAILEHTCQTRGFQLSGGVLSVVSDQGLGMVYNLTVSPPILLKKLDIEPHAVGHLDQTEDVVMYSMGSRGYHLHDKASGEILAAIQPDSCSVLFEIIHPLWPNGSYENNVHHGPTSALSAPPKPSSGHMIPLIVRDSLLDTQSDNEPELDEWGAGTLCENLMVGISRRGRVVICTDWRGVVQKRVRFAEVSYQIACQSNEGSFELGGWLSVRDNKVMFEIEDKVYVVKLDDSGRPILEHSSKSTQSSFAVCTSSASPLNIPVSYMSLHNDCLLMTYSTLGWRQRVPGTDPAHTDRTRVFPTKAIRILSLASDITTSGGEQHPDKEKMWSLRLQSARDERAQASLRRIARMLDEDGDRGVEGTATELDAVEALLDSDESDDEW